VVAHLDADLADGAIAPHGHRGHVADQALPLGDRGADLGQLPGHVGLFDPVQVIDRQGAS
jgi:hypothetical protein